MSIAAICVLLRLQTLSQLALECSLTDFDRSKLVDSLHTHRNCC